MTSYPCDLYNPAMSGLENRIRLSQASPGELDNNLSFHNRDKYTMQVGLRDIDFDIDHELLKVIGLRLPFENSSLAEDALVNRVLRPTRLKELDDTEHTVLIFDPRPVGYSGFMNCVTHSIILTNHGLFEVGRYPAMSLATESRYWQWFLHRRLATIPQVNAWCEDRAQFVEGFMRDAYQALTNR